MDTDSGLLTAKDAKNANGESDAGPKWTDTDPPSLGASAAAGLWSDKPARQARQAGREINRGAAMGRRDWRKGGLDFHSVRFFVFVFKFLSSLCKGVTKRVTQVTGAKKM
jgi:hypothetical protein